MTELTTRRTAVRAALGAVAALVPFKAAASVPADAVIAQAARDYVAARARFEASLAGDDDTMFAACAAVMAARDALFDAVGTA